MRPKMQQAVLHRLVISTLATALLPLIFFGDCRADSAGQSPVAPAAFEARLRSVPISYTFNPAKGTLDDQSRSVVGTQTRIAVISSHGRSGNAGLYGIAALLLTSAGLIIWRRVRANT